MRCKQKILALLLAVALVLAMSSTALADGAVCKIGDTPYDTLQEAVNAAAAGTVAATHYRLNRYNRRRGQIPAEEKYYRWT